MAAEPLCVFELIYFARPDSMLDDTLVYSSRLQMGAQLAMEHPVDADVVIGIPDSANAAAVGYAQEAGIPYSEGLVKNRYVGRTFIEPDQRLRDLGVQLKFNPLPGVVKGKRVIVVDDSIVRGTTTPHVVSLLRRAGAVEVHMRVCAPPIRHPCHLGRGHGHPEGANSGQQEHRRHPGLRRRRLPGIPERRRAAEGRPGDQRRVLRRLLHRQLPHTRPAGDGQAGAGTRPGPGLSLDSPAKALSRPARCGVPLLDAHSQLSCILL